jgi:hypothetical protein
MSLKTITKSMLQSWPYSAEVYQSWLAKGKLPADGFSLERLDSHLTEWVEAVERRRASHRLVDAKRVLLIGCLPWWLEYITAVGIFLAGAGCEVEVAYSPYRGWTKEVTPFESRRQGAIIQSTLQKAGSLFQTHLLAGGSAYPLNPEFTKELEALSLRDVQYSMQREELDFAPGSEDQVLLGLRHARNINAAKRVSEILRLRRFDSVIIPNGSILEFGAARLAAQDLGVPFTTFEFGEQRERMWLSQNDEAMRLNTADLWAALGNTPLSHAEYQAIQDLYRARTRGETWKQFGRQWQKGESTGARNILEAMQLDPAKPVILLCTNVVGDSLALGRQIFTQGMSDWLTLTVQHLALMDDAQLVIRVHPGELLGAGHPSTEIVTAALPDLPATIKVIPPDASINTYDLIEVADLGLVYTTTVGLEMAMWGIPVFVAGQTHYRSKGFTIDPETVENYFEDLDAMISTTPGKRLDQEQIELAWRYAYRFFFQYPFRFPWHLVGFWDDVQERPMQAVLQEDTLSSYQRAIHALVGQSIDWNAGGMH